MTGIIRFQALAFDLLGGELVQRQQVDCESPALAIQTASGFWKIFGYAGAVAFSRASFFDGKPGRTIVLRRFGQVPDEYLARAAGEE